MVKERFSVPVSTMREAVVSDTAQLAVILFLLKEKEFW